MGDIDFVGHGTAPPARFLSIFEKRPGSHGEATRQRTLAAENARKNVVPNQVQVVTNPIVHLSIDQLIHLRNRPSIPHSWWQSN